MNKLTKIVATIGPVTDSEEMIEKLILAGVNVFRFNFKHNSVEYHSERIQRVNAVAKKLGLSIGTLIDLQGPEIRINMPYDQIDCKDGESYIFGEEAFEKKEVGFSITHPNIIQYLVDGQKLIADDGAFTFYVEKKKDKTYLKSATTGTLKQRKTLNIPGADFPFPVLVDRDFEGLALAQKNEVDYVALSFVRSAEDMRVVKAEMKKYNFTAKTVAKIETEKALHDIDAIIEESDAIMIARGDLGVELPIEQVPYYQKVLIKKCIEVGKPVITATQMLQTMIDYPYPTRAEVSDIANACYDQTDAIMLSGETASGKYPLQAVEMMAKTAAFNERKFLFDIRKKHSIATTNVSSVVTDAAYDMYLRLQKTDVKPSGFLVFTQTGATARFLSRYRPVVPIYAFASEKEIADSLTVLYGVQPYTNKVLEKNEVNKSEIFKAIHFLTEKGLVKKGEKLIVVHGDYWAVEGGTSTVKVVTV